MPKVLFTMALFQLYGTILLGTVETGAVNIGLKNVIVDLFH